MSKNQEYSKNSGIIDDLIVPIFIIGLLIFVYFAIDAIYLVVWRVVRIIEIYPLAFLSKFIQPIEHYFSVQKLLYTLQNTNADDIRDNYDTFARIDAFYSMFFVPIFGFILIRILKNKRKVNKHLYKWMHGSGDELIKLNAEIYPHLQAIKDAPQNNDVYTYRRGQDNSLAEPLNYLDFAIMTPPLGLENDNVNKLQIFNEKTEVFNIYLAEKALISQLGNLYQGIESLNATNKKLFEFLIQKIKPDAVELKSDMIGNQSAESVFSKITTTDDPKIIIGRTIMESHAYVRTGLMSLFSYARMFSLIKPAKHFHWLKTEDRVLWYAIQGVSMNSYYVESLGVNCHWLFEIAVAMPVITPCIDDGVEGLKQALLGDINKDDV